MPERMKDRLRRRLLGRRLVERLYADHRTTARLGNRYYYRDESDLAAPGYQPPVEAYEFSRYSQNGEDGIILELLARIGVAGHRVVEVGTGDGRECNSANLVLEFGWQAELFEADAAAASAAGDYFRDCGARDRVRVHHAMTTPDNINVLLREAGATGDIDVLSIDIDSIDYWLWRSIDAVHPPVVVIEYNASLGPERSLTVPFPFVPQPGLQSYHGASLAALTRLAQEKGYLLAGCDSRGINAFYVHGKWAAKAGIKDLSVAAAFRPHYWRSRTKTLEEQFAEVAHLPWTEVQ